MKINEWLAPLEMDSTVGIVDMHGFEVTFSVQHMLLVGGGLACDLPSTWIGENVDEDLLEAFCSVEVCKTKARHSVYDEEDQVEIS